ncbi:hypothetical protein B9Z55_015726 [Caenorhabditis nigoni]|uniref:Clusterin-associated protein 1 n=1 Tax=Caenorhabditis nigoni TaxID=1611254 RepID=A0A2G5UC35_9PELO|nr:hypothetical protein B9Z55_015726 [Caenorhabditis nigoni]
MSYRELRNLCEMTRTLRYPRLMSIENFRSPNFQLVAELLEWIVKKSPEICRFEPDASLDATSISTEAERVEFVKNAVLLMLQNSRIKMNPKKLYQADGHAVQELLPALKILFSAKSEDMDSGPKWNQIKNKLSSKMQEVRITRQLSNQLPETGALLSELLSKHEYLSNQHEKAAARSIPLAEAEKLLNATIQGIAQDAEQLAHKFLHIFVVDNFLLATVVFEIFQFQNKLNNVASDEAELDEKIERKKREYEQLQKRFAKLQAFRPQYMDEYERFEERLQKLYEVYVLNFRNLAYLRKVHDDLARSERQRQEELEKAMRLTVEKMRMEQERKDAIGLADDDTDAPLIDRRQSVRKVYGNMMGGAVSDDDDDDDEDDEIIRMEENPKLAAKTAKSVDTEEEEEGNDYMIGINVPRGDDAKSDLSSGDDF